MLTAPRSRARSVSWSTSPAAAVLCGNVTMHPGEFLPSPSTSGTNAGSGRKARGRTATKAASDAGSGKLGIHGGSATGPAKPDARRSFKIVVRPEMGGASFLPVLVIRSSLRLEEGGRSGAGGSACPMKWLGIISHK